MSHDRVTVQRLPKSRIVCTVTFKPEEVAPAEEKALRSFEPQLKIDGFRPGFAPLEMIRPKVPVDALFEETIRMLLRDTIADIVRDEKLFPIVPPKVEAQSRDPLVLAITFIEKPEVTIKNIDSISIKKKEATVEQKDIDRIVETVLSDHRTKTPTDRASQKGDELSIDFHATKEDGTPVDGLSAQDYEAAIGSNTLLPGFEDALIGLKKGEQKTFTLVLPEKFPTEELRGKSAIFHVTAKEVHNVVLPELTDDFAKEKLQSESAQAFKDTVKKSLLEREEEFMKMEHERLMMEEIQKHTQADIADELLDEEVRGMIQEWGDRLERQGTTIEEALKRQNKKPEEVEKEMREEAAKRWKLRLGLAKIIEHKGISLTDDELEQAFNRFLMQVPEQERVNAKSEWAKRGNLFEEIRWRTLVEKTMDQLLAA